MKIKITQWEPVPCFWKIPKIIIMISFILLVACAPKNDAVSIANKFVKLYYQQMNQQEAIKLSSMMAKEKLEKESDLVHDNRINNPQPAENRAKVTFKLEETKIDKDMCFISYILTIQPTGATPFDKTALITLQNEKSAWKVINYEEVNAVEK